MPRSLAPTEAEAAKRRNIALRGELELLLAEEKERDDQWERAYESVDADARAAAAADGVDRPAPWDEFIADLALTRPAARTPSPSSGAAIRPQQREANRPREPEPAAPDLCDRHKRKCTSQYLGVYWNSKASLWCSQYVPAF